MCEEEGLELSWNTPSQRIELYSQTLEEAGVDPMPVFRMPEQPPPGSFRLLTGRSPVHTFGRTTNNRFLSTCDDENEVWVNPDAARSLPGFEAEPLRPGERVVLVNQDDVRSEPVKVRLTSSMRRANAASEALSMVWARISTAKLNTSAQCRSAILAMGKTARV